MNIDVPSALSTAVSALPNILALRDAALRLPDFDIAHFDRLQQYIFALGHAHAKFLAASESLRAAAALRERGIKVRDAMYLDAMALAHRGLLNRDRLADFKAKVGYKNLALGLLGLSALFREHWGQDRDQNRRSIERARRSGTPRATVDERIERTRAGAGHRGSNPNTTATQLHVVRAFVRPSAKSDRLSAMGP